MYTSIPGRFNLSQEDVILLQELGVEDPIFDKIPDSVFVELDKLIANANSELGRAELEELCEKLIMAGSVA